MGQNLQNNKDDDSGKELQQREKAKGSTGPKKTGLVKTIWGIVKDVLIAAAIVGIFMGILYAYSGVWPPPVVVESQSMSHDPPSGREVLPPSQIGVIDGGDMVIVKKVQSRTDITPYVQGQKTGYQTYGSHGDVIIYKPPESVRRDSTPVIHRAVLWIEFNTTSGAGWDLPEMGLYNTVDTITLQDYGYNGIDVRISLGGILNYFKNRDPPKTPHSGFITMGDHNAPTWDQETSICPEPVAFEWVIGVARGELPWFGGLKLWASNNYYGVPENSWYYLAGSITAIFVIPITLDYIIARMRKKKASKDTNNAKSSGDTAIEKDGKNQTNTKKEPSGKMGETQSSGENDNSSHDDKKRENSDEKTTIDD